MADHEPNEIVTDLATGLSEKGVTELQEAAKALREADAAAEGEKKSDLATKLANLAGLPELVTFAGFLGGLLEDGGGRPWRLLYTDWQLSRWLLVREEDIVFRKVLRGDKSPAYEEHDVIWVKSDASVGQGKGSPSVEARFLTGDFTRAGDFEAPPAGGAPRGPTGFLCQVITPYCYCRRTTRC